MDGAGKLGVQQEELHDASRRNAPVALAVHFESAGRTQHSRPLDVVERSSHVGKRAEKNEVFHVEYARGLVGAFELAAEAAEVPRLAMRHGGIGHTGEEVAGEFDFG